jgi:hypothetical protein
VVKRTARVVEGGALGGDGGGGVVGLKGELMGRGIPWEGEGVGSVSTAICSSVLVGGWVRHPFSERVRASATEPDLRISDFCALV